MGGDGNDVTVILGDDDLAAFAAGSSREANRPDTISATSFSQSDEAVSPTAKSTSRRRQQ